MWCEYMYVKEQPVQLLLSVDIRHTDIADSAVVALTATGNDCILFATLYSLYLRQNMFCESFFIRRVCAVIE